MKLEIASIYNNLSERAAEWVIRQIERKPASVFVFATGNTPLGMFSKLVEAHKAGRISFKQCILIELDDYFDIALDDHRNLYNWLYDQFIRHVDMADENIIRLDTAASDPVEEAKRVERATQQLGGIDLMVLGLGMNGHLGFNEPGSEPDSATRAIELSEASIISSSGYWGEGEEIPHIGITLGLKTISEARKILLLASGIEKSVMLDRALFGPVTSKVPASFLQNHRDIRVIVDIAACRRIFTRMTG